MLVGVLFIIVITGVVTTNVLAGVMTALEFAISQPFKEFGC